MSPRGNPNDSDSENEEFYSADENEGSDQDETMDWEAPLSSVSIPCDLSDKEFTSKAILCANAATFMAGIQSKKMLRQTISEHTLRVRCFKYSMGEYLRNGRH